MAKKKSDKKYDKGLPVADIFPPREMFKVNKYNVETRKLYEIAELIWLPESLEEDERKERIVRALELYESLKPASGAEGMLAVQMVGTHFAALECLRRAALPNQTFEGRNMALNHAQKLMALHTKQLAALDKHRGKGQQKVTVEHVNVAAGGQAIVGNVDVKKATSKSGDHALTDVKEAPIDVTPSRKPSKPKVEK